MDRVFIIAEAGVNHNGDVSVAEKLIDAAVKSGADAVKFQTFRAEELCSQDSPLAEYQKENCPVSKTQYQMLKDLQLNEKMHIHLMNYAKMRHIKFMSSPFDITSIDLLDRLGMDIFKIPSGEITNLPYLERIGSLGRQVILSTGMADMDEIRFAVEVINKAGTDRDNIALLHCCTDYPASMEDVNLKAIRTMAGQFECMKIGYSDHTEGIEAAVAAVAMGAVIIEKHFTLDRNMSGPDHRASLVPGELKGMVCAIRNIEKAMGTGIKQPSAPEIKNRAIVRKSIVALKNIKKGEKFSQSNITTKRPGTGISPVEWYNVLGKKAVKNFKADELICF